MGIIDEIKEIYRTNRKTLALHLKDDGELIVRAPNHMKDKDIKKFVIKKRFWVYKKRKELEEINDKASQKEFVNGEGFLYLGEYYKLEIVRDDSIPLKFEKKFLLSEKYLNNAKEIFINWYKKEAKSKISKRANYYSRIVGKNYRRIRIINAQKRWGSCGKNNSINFSWRLIMAPIKIIDYVVVHELTHLREKNHSKKFWGIVKTILPDYKESQQWLKENGYLLNI